MYIPDMKKIRKTERIAARLTPEAAWLIEALAKKKGIVRSGILEMAVRDYAEREGVPMPTQEQLDAAK